MARTKGLRMSEAASAKLRETIAVRCGWKRAAETDRKRVTRERFTAALPGLADTNLRWLERAMSSHDRLPFVTARELAARCMLVTHTQLPYRLLRPLFVERPEMILFPGQATLVAKAVANKSREWVENYLRPREEAFHSRVGEAAVRSMKATFGDEWEELVGGKTRVSHDRERMFRPSDTKRLIDDLPPSRKP